MPYTFEILDPNVIVASLYEEGIELSTEDIVQPDAKVMRQVYQHIVEQVMCVSREEIQEPDLDVLNRTVVFPDLHQHSIPDVMFHLKLRDLMQRVQITDFRKSDVTNPEYKRTVRNLSAIINFLKFRAERQSMFERLHQDLEGLAQVLDSKVDEVNRLEHQVKGTIHQYQSEEQVADSLKGEVASLEKEVGRLNEYQAELKSENSSLKEQHKEEKERRENIHYLVLSSRKEVTRLKNNIVPSPDKLKQSLLELEESVESEKRALKEADEEGRQYQDRLDQYNRLEKEIQKSIAMMDEFDVDMGKIAELKQAIQETKDTLASTTAKKDDQQGSIHNLKRQIQGAQEKLDRLEEKHSLKSGVATNALEQALNERDTVEKENLALEQQIQTIDENKRSIEHSMVSMKKDHYEALRLMSSQYDELKSQVDRYHSHLRRALQPTA